MKLKYFIRSIGFLLFTVLFSVGLNSQISNPKKTDTIKASPFLDSQKEIKPLNLTLIDTTTKNSIFDFKPRQILQGLEPIANKYFDPFNTNQSKTINFMSKTNKVEADVLVKKSFLGQDVSNVKLTSDYNLGTLQSKSKSVRIEVRDHSLVDGDRIKVYLNEQLINANIMLNGLYYIIPVDLRKGYNRIDIEALNEGYSGPNTAQLNVYDEKGNLLSSQEWNILTGQRATLGVVRN